MQIELLVEVLSRAVLTIILALAISAYQPFFLISANNFHDNITAAVRLMALDKSAL